MVVGKIRLQVKNALLNKLGFVQPPYFYTPWEVVCTFMVQIRN